MINFIVNIVCVLIGLYFTKFIFGDRLKWPAYLASKLGAIIMFSLVVISMICFHVPWMLAPISNGIPPDHYGPIVVGIAILGLLSIRSYLKMKANRSKAEKKGSDFKSLD